MSNNRALVERFAAAFNNHDLDTLMDCMTQDCVFYTVGGGAKLGVANEGQEKVRAAFAATFANFPDSQWLDPEIYIDGDVATLITTYTVSNAEGKKTEARMVDVLTIVNGKIKFKNAFRKVLA